MLCCALLCPYRYLSAGVRVQGVWLSTAQPDRVLAGLNQRQKSVFDVYSIDLKSQKMTLHTVNPGNATTWVMDPSFDVAVSRVRANSLWQRHLLYKACLRAWD